MNNIDLFNLCVADVLGACYEQFPVKIDLYFDEIGNRVASQFPSDDGDELLDVFMSSLDVVSATIQWLSQAGYLWIGNEFYGGVTKSTLTPKSLELLNMVPESLKESRSLGSVLAAESKTLGREAVLSIVRTVLSEGAKFSVSGHF